MSSRLAILNRIRQGAGKLPEFPSVTLDLPVNILKESESLPEKFAAELKLLNVETYIEDSDAAVQECLEQLIAGKKLLSWDAANLPYEPAGIIVGDNVIPNSESLESRAQAEIGITGCDAAIAETGTLALVSAPDKPRTVSLLPYCHIAIVRRDQILPDLGTFFRKFRQELRNTSCLNLITGPSRTADIELQLTLGVHGPGRMIVIIGP